MEYLLESIFSAGFSSNQLITYCLLCIHISYNIMLGVARKSVRRALTSNVVSTRNCFHLRAERKCHRNIEKEVECNRRS